MKTDTDDSVFSVVNPYHDLAGELPDLPVRRPAAVSLPLPEPEPEKAPAVHVPAISRARTALLVEIERGGRTDPANLLSTSDDVLEVAARSKSEERIAAHITTVVDLLNQHIGLFGDVDGNISDALSAIRYSDDQPRVLSGEHGGEWVTGGGGHLSYSGLAKAAQEGGFSVTVHGKAPSTGFMVSPYKKAERRYDAATFSRADVHAYRDSHRALLARPDHYLGGWRDGDTIYLDVSIHASSRGDAVAIATKHGQLAFYDLDNGVTVPTGAGEVVAAHPTRFPDGGGSMKIPFALIDPEADDEEIDAFVAALRGEKAQPSGPQKRVVVDALGNLHDDHTGQFTNKDGGGDGGSAEKSGFDRETYTAKSIPDRKTEFQKLSQEERDKAADPVNSVPARQAELLKGLPDRPDSGSAEDRVFARVAQMAALGTVNDQAASLIQDQGNRVAYALKEMGVELELASRISLDVVDAVAAQEVETLGRTLGDHGARHLEGDTRMALEALAAMGEVTPEQQAFMAIAGAFHDTGYMTEPSQVFLDEDHPRWSQQYFDGSSVSKDVAAALGDDVAARMSEIIGTHADTDLDWKGDPEGSAFRLADNLALFHEEKLPAMFEYVKGNTSELVDFARGEKSLDEAKAAMHENIDGSKLSDSMKERLNAAVEETSGILPKLTMGMVGAKVGEIGWQGDHVTVDLIRTTANEDLLKALDMGQRQFDKFAKTYGVDPAEFSKTGTATFSQDGVVVLEAEIVKVESRMVEMLVRRGVAPVDALAFTRQLRLKLREDALRQRGGGGGEGPYDSREGSWVKEADGTFAGSGDGGSSGGSSSDKSGKPDKATVDEAVAALVKHEQPEVRARDVGAVFDACAKRTDNPDVTELKVKGTLLFGGEGLGIARADMPQIPKERRDEFLELLKSKGIDVTKEEVDPRDLKPIQKEISASRAGIMLQDMREAGGPSGRRMVSKDDFVVDGHHHWAAAVALAFERDDVQFPVFRIDAKHDKVMEIAMQWNEDTGISGKSLDEPVAEK